MQLIQQTPAVILSWLAVMVDYTAALPVAWQAFLATFAVGGIVVGVSIARQPAVQHSTTPWPVFDDRTAELVIDPTLNAADVEAIVEHVAPGAGSVVSVADAVAPTTMRGPRARAEVAAAEVAAHDEAARRADVDFFARFDRVMEVALAGFRERTVRADTWMHYLHEDATARCAHCAEAVAEVSDEFRLMVRKAEATMTGGYSLTELEALLAADVPV